MSQQEPFPIDRLPCIKRLEAMEVRADKLEHDIASILQGQAQHTQHLTDIASDHSAQLEKEAQTLRDSLLEQSKSILAVSQAMVHLQQAVQKWAAAGTLAGAVLLYIIAKAAGL